MIVAAVAMMRDEADICGRVVDHLWRQGVDRILVGDHGSVDDTAAILRAAGVEVVPLTDPGYWQSRFMSELARQAGEAGAEWIVPFDADEFWFADSCSVADLLRNSPHDIEMAASFEQFGDYRAEQPKRLSKVAFRYRRGVLIAQGNHDVIGAGPNRGWGRLTIRELQYRSFDQLCRKVRNGKQAYDATDLHLWEGAHWREMGALTDAELRVWWDQHLTEFPVFDPMPC